MLQNNKDSPPSAPLVTSLGPTNDVEIVPLLSAESAKKSSNIKCQQNVSKMSS